MNGLENLLLNLGMSWTFSKILPYLVAIVLGIWLVRFVLKRIRNKSKGLKVFVSIILLILPFGAYFAISPIYEGDFTNASINVGKDDSTSELTDVKLVVISIPNCPYCYESIDRLKKLKSRVPNAQIEMRVCSSDTSSLEWYKEKSGDAINVKLAENAEGLSNLAFGSFPTFVLVNNEEPMKVWENNVFGVMAFDEVENALK